MAKRPTLRFMFSQPVHIVSLGFGSGLLPWMPGTAGTLFGWLSFIVLDRYLTPVCWLAWIAASFAAGIFACGYTAKKLGVKDPGAANWDEIVAFWLVLLFVTPATFSAQLSAFVLFRFFDMVKPPPVRTAERRFSAGFGIMFDDIVAAFCTLLVIALWRAL